MSKVGIKRGHVFISSISDDAVIENCPVDFFIHEVRKDKRGKFRCSGCDKIVPRAELLQRGHR